MTNSEGKTGRLRVRDTLRDTRGTEIAEMAVVLPLLFMIVMGIFWFGQAFRIYGTLTQATRAGARAAVAPVCATCAPTTGVGPGQYAQTAVQNAMAAAHLSTNQLVQVSLWTTPAPALCPCGTSGPACAAVMCDGSVTIPTCVQKNVQLSYPAPANGPGGMGTCGTAVSLRYKYPFSFKIPYTGLDLGNIQLPGQAQMRAETQ
jgi:hypothetical protein